MTFRKFITLILICCFLLSPNSLVLASNFNLETLPKPGAMVVVSPEFTPLSLKGLVIDSSKPMDLEFLVATGDTAPDKNLVKEDADLLVKYFLAGLTIPESDIWVNLSPYEKDRIMPQSLAQTELGRDLLAQDYILKQVTASLIYPEKDLGKKFWAQVYEKARHQFGTTSIPMNTFTKVWILPDKVQVYEKGSKVVITQATLKVLLDQDYVSKNIHHNKTNEASEIVRQLVIPEIEKEVNQGENFAKLRQMYHALILAQWYKETVKNALFEKAYNNRNKIAGLEVTDSQISSKIYTRYLQAYKKGVFNYIRSEGNIPKKYFSGGITRLTSQVIDRSGSLANAQKNLDAAMAIRVKLTIKDKAMYVAINQKGEQIKLAGDLKGSIQKLIGQQVEAQIVNPIETSGENQVYYVQMEGVLIQVNPMREPSKRRVVARGKEGACPFCAGNMPAAEAGFPLNQRFMIYPSPSPYGEDHVVIAEKATSVGEHPIQHLKTIEQVRAMLEVLNKYNDPDYHVSFSAIDAGNSEKHWHAQAYKGIFPLTHSMAVDNFLEHEGVTAGFVKDYPGVAVRLTARADNQELLAQDVLEIVAQYIALAVPYNIVFHQNREDVEAYIFTRDSESPASKNSGLIKNKFGPVEMMYSLITYRGDHAKGLVQNGVGDWVEATADLFRRSLKAATDQDINRMRQIIERVMKAQKDLAMNGGIAMEGINISQHNKSLIVQVDPHIINAVLSGNFYGFSPRIIQIQSIIPKELLNP